MKKNLQRVFFLLVIILLSFWAIKPILHPGFFPMHDDTQPARVYEMSQALSQGQFPVRWVGDLGYGYGYPIFNFYAPLPYYIGAFFNLIGFDAIAATKFMFLIGIILAGIAMFYLLEYFLGQITAIVGSILYLYAPYYAIDIYVRGAVGEIYTMAFLPLILLGVIKIIRPFYSSSDPDLASGESRSNFFNSSRGTRTIKEGVVIGSFGLAGVFLSHNIFGMIVAYFFITGLAIYLVNLLIKRKKLSTFYFLLSTFLIGIGLASFFLLPAIIEKNYTRVNELTAGSSNFTNHFVFPDQFWSSPWGYAGSAPGRADGMSFMIGKINLLLGLFSISVIFFLYTRKKLKSSMFYVLCYLLFIFLVSIFLMMEQSKFIWDLLLGFSFIQYPWRFLVFVTFSLSIIISIAFSIFEERKQLLLAVVLITLTIWFNSKYFVPKEYLAIIPEDYISGINLRYKISKISDEYLPNDFIVPKSPDNVSWSGLPSDPNFKIIKSSETFSKKLYSIDVSYPTTVRTNITYFPGWQAKIDGKITPLDYRNGRLLISLPSGKHQVDFTFEDTPIRIFANAISIVSLFLVVYIIVLKKPHEKIFS